MQIWIAFIRGVNVGGNNKLPMTDLKVLLETAGLKDVCTYIQSGNVVFRGPKIKPFTLSHQIADLIEGGCGFRPHVYAISFERFQKSIEANPFPVSVEDGNKLHFFYLLEVPERPDEGTINSIKLKNEHWHLKDDVLYLHTPDGFGRSKFAARVEKILGVRATTRNWRTIEKIFELAHNLE